MPSRLTLLMGATALLYLGPLIGGLAGAGWPAVYAFAAVFVLWLAVMRPHEWPRDASRWRDPAVPLRAVTQVLVQLLLVAILFGIGRGIGGVAGYLPDLPLIWPLALSALSVPLSRLVWNPRRAAEMDRMLDDAISQMNAMAMPDPAAEASAARVVDEIAALGPDAALDAIGRVVRRAGEEVSPSALTQALRTAASAEDAPRTMVAAFMLHATDGEMAEMSGGDIPTVALRLLAPFPELVPAYATRMEAALDLWPGLWEASPSDDYLAERIGATTDPAAAAALTRLRDRLRDMAPEA